MKTFPPSLPWAPNRIQSREARKLVSNRLAETKKYAPEAKKVAQQEFQVRREYYTDNSLVFIHLGRLQSGLPGFKLQTSLFFSWVFGIWKPKLEHKISRIPVGSELCEVYCTYSYCTQRLYHLGHTDIRKRCCPKDFLNPSPSPSDLLRQQGAQRQAMEKRLAEASKRLQPLRKFRQAFRGLLVCGALWSRGFS